MELVSASMTGVSRPAVDHDFEGQLRPWLEAHTSEIDLRLA
jgi:hypothetical protein